MSLDFLPKLMDHTQLNHPNDKRRNKVCKNVKQFIKFLRFVKFFRTKNKVFLNTVKRTKSKTSESTFKKDQMVTIIKRNIGISSFVISE
jgi:hypothetical protein